MVDRLFWRAGFGPTQAQRDAWRGKTQAQLVDFFLNTPVSLDATMPAAEGPGRGAADRSLRDTQVELELDWIDRMQRAVNPLPQRLAFFWHRHWAISTADGSVSDKWAYAYRNHLLEYSDFAANPTLTFRQLAYEMTTKNAAMSAYLNLNANTKNNPNENYAREIMELFCLGPTHPDTGAPNYSAGGHRRAHARLHRLAAERHRVHAGRRDAEPGLREDHVRAQPVHDDRQDDPGTRRSRRSRARQARRRRRTPPGDRRRSTRRSTSCSSRPSTRSS